jgi:hypothetical protein
MNEARMDELARDPRFIPGIYNYCDAWCERCAFTSRCLNYAMAQEEEARASRSQDAEDEGFWDKLHETFENTMATAEEEGEETDFEIDEEELQGSIREQDEIHEAAQTQPCSRIARRYIEVVDNWFKSKEVLLGAEGDERESSARADIPGVEHAGDGVDIHDCLEVIRWYQRQIWVKLCRAASGTIHAEIEDLECCQEDADGSAKVALIGIERSIAAWAILLRRFPDHEDAIHALAILKRLLRQVEAAFPNARAFRRPGFDIDESHPAD